MVTYRSSIFWLFIVGVVFVIISIYYLKINFRGITTLSGADHAQMSREIMRGNFLKTKNIRPVALWQIHKHKKNITDLSKFPDTFNAPLNPLINSLVLAITKSKWSFIPENKASERYITNHIFDADWFIIFTSIILLFCTSVIYYVLIKNLFDGKIAVLTVFIFVTTLIFWEQSQTGMAHCLTHFLFALTLFCIYKIFKNDNYENYTYVVISSILFGLLLLSNYLMFFCIIGFLTYIAFKSKNKLLNSLTLLFFIVLISGYFLYNNYSNTGSLFGSFHFYIYSALNNGDIRTVMGKYEDSYNVIKDGLLRLLAQNLYVQFQNFSKNYGLNLAIPAAIISYLYFFKKPLIEKYKWSLIYMWIPAIIGMALFGIYDNEIDKFQLHSIFIPIFTAYGIAFIFNIWKKEKIVSTNPWLTLLPIIIIILINFIPLFLKISKRLPLYLRYKYIVSVEETQPRQSNLIKLLSFKKEILISDIPASSAWYGDTSSMLLPLDKKSYKKIEEYTTKSKNRLIGINFTPQTLRKSFVTLKMESKYMDWWEYIKNIGDNKAPNQGYLRFSTRLRMDKLNMLFLDSPTRVKLMIPKKK